MEPTICENEFDQAGIPRKIFTYWHQGFSKAPTVVQACIAQLRHVNPGWHIQMLDSESVENLERSIPISPAKLDSLGLAARSDILRTRLLIEHGGVWADPTVWVTQPFDSWLHEKSDAGLFVFSRPGRDRLISSWFIAAVPQHPILTRLYDELCTYWEDNNFRNLGRDPNVFEQQLRRVINRNLEWPGFWFSFPAQKILRLAPYFWFHYLFYRVLKKHKELNEIFARMPVVSALDPIRLLRHGLLSNFDSQAEEILADVAIPVHKLTWKLPEWTPGDDTVLDHLTEIAGNLRN